MGVDHGASRAETATVDNRGVIEAVGEDDILRFQQPLENAGIGGIAGVEEKSALGPLEGGEALLELAMGEHTAGDEAAAAAADTVTRSRRQRRLDQGRMLGEAEIVVGAKKENATAVDEDGPLFARFHRAQGPEHPRRSQIGQLLPPTLHHYSPASISRRKRPGRVKRTASFSRKVTTWSRLNPSRAKKKARPPRPSPSGFRWGKRT